MNRQVTCRGFWAVMLVITALYAAMFVLMPLSGDDYWFMYYLKDYYDSGRSHLPLGALYNTWQWHYDYDNTRVSNIAFLFFLLLPKWIPSLLSALALLVSLLITSRLAGVKGANGAIAISLLFTFTLPWYDHIAELCFLFNYVWSTALMLIAIELFFVGDRPKVKYCLIMALAGCLLGAWHEGFGVPVLAASMTTIALYRRFRTIDRWLFIAGLIGGTTFLFMSKGAQLSMDELINTDILETVKRVLKWSYMPIIFLGTTVVFLLKKHLRERLDMPPVIFLVVATLTSLAILVKACIAPRVDWAAQICSIAGIVMMGRILSEYYSFNKKALSVLSSLALLITVVHLTAVDLFTAKLNKEVSTAIDIYLSSDSGEIFTDYSTYFDANPLLFGRPREELLIEPWNLKKIRQYYRRVEAFNPVPTVLRDYTADQGEPMPGTPGLRKYSNYFILPMTPRERDAGILGRNLQCHLKIEYGNTITEKGSGLIIPFTSQADGQRYWFVHPLSAGFMNYFLPVTRLEVGNAYFCY